MFVASVSRFQGHDIAKCQLINVILCCQVKQEPVGEGPDEYFVENEFENFKGRPMAASPPEPASPQHNFSCVSSHREEDTPCPSPPQ